MTLAERIRDATAAYRKADDRDDAKAREACARRTAPAAHHGRTQGATPMTRRPEPHTGAPSDFWFRVDSMTLEPGQVIVRDNGERWLVGSQLNGGLFGRQLLDVFENATITGPAWDALVKVNGKGLWQGELREIKAEWLVRVEERGE